MKLFDCITGILAKQRDRQERRKHERQEAMRREQFERHRKELELLAHKAFLEHIKECQDSQFEHNGIKDGSHIWLKNFFNPHEGERETEVGVVSRMLDQALVVTFSQRAVLKRQEWRPICRPRRHAAPVPA